MRDVASSFLSIESFGVRRRGRTTASASVVRPVECELLDRRRFKTQAEARTAVFEFVEAFYNRRRRHSSIGYLSPIDYERRHAANPDAHQPATVLASVKDKPFGQKFVEGFGRRPRRGGAARRRGRGPKAFRERTRGKWVSALPRVLWGFRRDVGARGRC
jgi:Integrase core domain